MIDAELRPLRDSYLPYQCQGDSGVAAISNQIVKGLVALKGIRIVAVCKISLLAFLLGMAAAGC